jgi:DNA adenine methylase
MAHKRLIVSVTPLPVMQAVSEIKRPALRYYGGKWLLAPWIISHFPKHVNYIEPCGGAASVLLQKPRSELETYNDIDRRVTTFFKVLRDKPDDLIHKIRLTPWARSEFELAQQDSDDEIELARRTAVYFWQSIAGTNSGWRCCTTASPEKSSRKNCELDLQNIDFYAIARRFIGVQIEQKNAFDVIRTYDNNEALIYFDPPYIKEERSHKNQYKFEVDNAFHFQAAILLRQCQGFVVVSGYANQLYTELYENFGWARIDKEAITNSGGKRIESLWLSPRTVEALRCNNGLHATPGSAAQIQMFN